MQRELSRDGFDAVLFELEAIVGDGDGERVQARPGALELARKVRGAGPKTALFAQDPGLAARLDRAGLADAFNVLVERPTAAPELAAERLGVPVGRCVLLARAASVGASTRGYAWLVAVDSGGGAPMEEDAAADVLVSDPAELAFDASSGLRVKTVHGVGSLWAETDALAQRVRERPPVVLLDYDGTLTPIVSHHRNALLSEAMRETLVELARHCVVAVISGRDLDDVRRLVGIDSIYYSGSHGFELAGPDDWRFVQPDAAGFVPALDEAEGILRERLAGIEGHLVERKGFSVAVHYRQVDEGGVKRLKAVVADVLAHCPTLRRAAGKKVVELQPRIPWDKGRAAARLLERLGTTAASAFVVYIGDDLTDETVFRLLSPPSLRVVIRDGDRPTAADYALQDSEDVRRFLQWLAEAASRTRT